MEEKGGNSERDGLTMKYRVRGGRVGGCGGEESAEIGSYSSYIKQLFIFCDSFFALLFFSEFPL